MSIAKYFAFTGMSEPKEVNLEPGDAHVHSVKMDGEFYKGCMFSDASWFVKPFVQNGFFKHNSDELLVFIGSDPDDPENLNAEIELWPSQSKSVLYAYF